MPSDQHFTRSPAPESVIFSESEVDRDDDSETSVEYSSSPSSSSSNKLYLQLALYAGGNILTIVIVLGLWTVWTLLSSFRDAMLWALLCSTALQDVKEHVVHVLRQQLAKERCTASLCRETNGGSCSVKNMMSYAGPSLQ